MWSEIPVYAVKTEYLKQRLVRELAARELASNILTNGNHPSVIVWSIGNELSARPGPVQGFYIARAAASAKRLDPTRPVGYAVAGYPAAGCQPEYGRWTSSGSTSTSAGTRAPTARSPTARSLSAVPRQRARLLPRTRRSSSPSSAPRPTATARSRRRAPTSYQQDFVNYHLGVYASKPWLSGAVYWALEEFRVRPGWEGGNPRPQPPIHQKGLITLRRGRASRRSSTSSGSSASTPQLRPRAALTRRVSLPSAAAMAKTTTTALRAAARRRLLAGDPPPAPRGPRARRALRRRRGPAVASRSTSASCVTPWPAPARCSSSRSTAAGTPAVLKDSQRPPGARRDHARRPAARRPQGRHLGRRRARADRRRGRARHQGGRRARARHPRDQHRGAAVRHPRDPRARRVRDGDQRHAHALRRHPAAPA